jgi:hypothetical protein
LLNGEKRAKKVRREEISRREEMRLTKASGCYAMEQKEA